MSKILTVFCEIQSAEDIRRIQIGRVAVELDPEGEVNIRRLMLNLRGLKNIFEKKIGKKEKSGVIQGERKEKGGLSVDFINKPEWRDLFAQWTIYRRKDLKKPFKTQRGMEKQYKDLWQLSGGDIKLAADIVKQSMDNEWRGFFALPVKKCTSPQSGLVDTDWKKEQAVREAAMANMFGEKSNER